jgi:phasin family protein
MEPGASCRVARHSNVVPQVVSRDHESDETGRKVAAVHRRKARTCKCASQGGEHGNTIGPRHAEELRNGLGLSKIDLDKLIEVHRKNIDALGRSLQVASEGAKSLAEKQREIIETAFRETSTAVRDFKPTGNPQEILAKQTEFAKKAFDITVQNTRDIAELVTKTTGDATAIMRDRLRESLSELRDSVGRADSEASKKP